MPIESRVRVNSGLSKGVTCQAVNIPEAGELASILIGIVSSGSTVNS
jgi:hypothetical protein